MAKLVWGAAGERRYETGVDRGVLYLDSGAYPWNGLTAVKETPSGGEATPFYIDGFKYLNLASAEEFEATLEAFSSPLAFDACDGTSSIRNGLYVTQQPRLPFDFSYRSLIGNDVDGQDHGYKLHIVYGALAAPSEQSNETISDKPTPNVFSWKITTLPPKTSGHNYRPTAHFVVDSTQAPAALLSSLEDMMYGTDLSIPRIPSAQELLDLFASYA